MYWGKHVTYIFFDQFQMCSLWLCSDIYNPNFTYTYGEEYANYTYCYWRPAEIASKGPARKANCGAKEKAITEFLQILYTEQ